jgi:protocatechuate 3,4-dioxygenase, beta subunit
MSMRIGIGRTYSFGGGLADCGSRRRFLATGVGASAAFLGAMWRTPGAFAQELFETPPLTEGPFYPDKLPLDTDNDLLVLNDSLTPAVGEITHLSGRILGPNGSPLRNVFVEIWQVDNQGSYLHSQSSGRDGYDKNFQGYGRFLTDAEGRYYFRTIKPVPYPGRTPHIHYGISKNGKRIFTTQLLVSGEPLNEKDGVFKEIRNPVAREALLADFKKVPDSKIGELAATFDIQLGATPEDKDDRGTQGGVGKPERGTRRRR